MFWILWQLSLLVYPMFRYHWVHFKTTSVRFEDSPPSSTSMVSHPAPNELKGGGRGRIGEAADKEKGEHQLGEETSFVQAPSTTAEIVSQSVSRPSEDGQSRPISSQTTASSSTAGESSSSGGGVDDVIPDPAPVRPDSHKKPVATIMRRGSTAGNDDTGVSPSSLGYSGTSSWAKDPDNWDNVFRDAYLIFLSIVLVITVSEIEAKYSVSRKSFLVPSSPSMSI